MEPIFAAQSNRLTALSPLGRLNGAWRNRDWPQAVEEVEPISRSSLDGRRSSGADREARDDAPEPRAAPAFTVTIGPDAGLYEGLDGEYRVAYSAIAPMLRGDRLDLDVAPAKPFPTGGDSQGADAH